MGAHDDKWGHMRTHGERSHILLWPGGHPITLQKYQNVFSIFLNPSSSPSSWKQILPERLFLVQIQVALPVPLSYCCYQEIQFHCHHYFVIMISVLSSSHHCIISVNIIIVFPLSPLLAPTIPHICHGHRKFGHVEKFVHMTDGQVE